MAAGTPATTGGGPNRLQRGWKTLTGTKPRAIFTTVVALGLIQSCSAGRITERGIIVEGLNQIGRGLGEIVGGVLGVPIRGVGGGIEGVVNSTRDVAKDIDELNIGGESTGDGGWGYPTLTPKSYSSTSERATTPVPSGSGSQEGETKGMALTPEDTINLFDITREDGKPVDPSDLHDCPPTPENPEGEPEGTCYMVSGEVNVRIPEGGNQHSVDGDPVRGGTTYDDSGRPGDYVGLVDPTVRPGTLEGY